MCRGRGCVNVYIQVFALIYANSNGSCQFSGIKCAILLCLLDFFVSISEIHCRSPTGQSIQKIELIGGIKMQYVVDTYILEYIEDEDKYYISFKDSAKKECKIEIDKEIFDTYMKSKRAYVKIKNETSRHLEHSTLTEEDMHKRAFNQSESVEDTVMKNIEKEKLNEALQALTDAQYRRIDLHIINEITIKEVAKLEKVQKRQIEKSIRLGLKKIKKFFE